MNSVDQRSPATNHQGSFLTQISVMSWCMWSFTYRQGILYGRCL